MIGLWARSTEVRGGMAWDFVYARRLLSNGTYRLIHDAVLGFEHCMVAKARRTLDAPPRYLAQVKTDCLLTQRLPKRFTERLRALEALRHPDGTPVYRVEETKPLLGSSRAPRMDAERPKHGGGTRWTNLSTTAWRATPCCSRACRAPERRVARLREQGECPRRTAPRRTRLGAQTANRWARRYVRGGSAQKLDWLVVEEISWTWRSGRTWPAWG